MPSAKFPNTPIARFQTLRIRPLTHRLLSTTVLRRRTSGRSPLASQSDSTLPLEGIAKLGLKKKESKFVQIMKPIFPFVRNWTLIDKIFTTLVMLLIIRSLYFFPILGIDRENLPSNIRLTSLEQSMLAELFMAHDSIPLNFALLGISPLIVSGFFMQMIINIQFFQFIPSPIQHLISQKRMGTLTQKDLESASFKLALVAGFVMAYKYVLMLKPFSTGGWFFVLTTISGMLGALSITHSCCNVIQQRGLGEGTGFLLLGLTLSGFGKKVYFIFQSLFEGLIPVWKVAIVLLLYLTIVCCCVLFHEVHLRLPLTNYGMRNNQRASTGALPLSLAKHLKKGQEQPTPVSSAPYFPIAISQTAVTALFLSSSVVTVLRNFLMKWIGGLELLGNGPLSILLFGITSFCLCLLPIGGLTASNASDYLAGMEVGIKGVVPGDQTIAHLKKEMFKTQLFGACCLFFIVISCLSLDTLCASWIGTPIGSLNLVLLVAVISAGFKTMEAHIQSSRVTKILQKEKEVVSLFQQSTL